MNTLQDRTQEIVSLAKVTTTNCTKSQSSSKQDADVQMVELEASLISSFKRNQVIDLNKYCSYLDQLKVATAEKCLESDKEKKKKKKKHIPSW